MIIRNQYTERANITSNKCYQRLDEKTQVLPPKTGRTEVVKTRLTHSEETATSSMIIASFIAQKLNTRVDIIDYKGSLENICLLHDVGHPPFGHDGATMINNFFKDLGLEEGFSDNNNNIVCLEKNNFDVSQHVLVSLIKYPEKLYADQKEKYLPLLKEEIQNDYIHFSEIGLTLKNQSRTIACQIMDEADRNSYTCSDLADFFCLGGQISFEQVKYVKNFDMLNQKNLTRLSEMIEIVNSGSKSKIKSYFHELMIQFNTAFTLTENGITVFDQDLFDYREFLSDVEFEFFIKPIRQETLHADNMAMLKDFLEYVVDNGYYPSNTYKKLIKNETDSEQILRYIRNMVSEVSDWYIIKYFQKRNSGELS